MAAGDVCCILLLAPFFPSAAGNGLADCSDLPTPDFASLQRRGLQCGRSDGYVAETLSLLATGAGLKVKATATAARPTVNEPI